MPGPMDQGLLPQPAAPGVSAPGAAPGAPVTPTAAAPGAAPGATPGAAPAIGTPQVERDYNANPINEQDLDEVDKFTIMATKIIHTPQTRDMILSRIKGVQHPYDETADASLVVIDRIEQEQQWDQAVKLLGGVNAIGQVIELLSAAGKLPPELPEEDRKTIIGQTMQKYYKQKIASGEITKEQAARDAHLVAMSGAGAEGAQMNQRLAVTQDLSRQNRNPLEKAQGVAGGLQTPRPAANPMQPETTMKDTLANQQGGLLDG